jgi:hypothetical protein
MVGRLLAPALVALVLGAPASAAKVVPPTSVSIIVADFDHVDGVVAIQRVATPTIRIAELVEGKGIPEGKLELVLGSRGSCGKAAATRSRSRCSS